MAVTWGRDLPEGSVLEPSASALRLSPQSSSCSLELQRRATRLKDSKTPLVTPVLAPLTNLHLPAFPA